MDFTGSTRCNLWLGSEVVLVMFVVVMVTGILTTYAVASLRDDVRAVWPYISDTADHSPERCFFALFCCIGGILAIITSYIHFKQVKMITAGSDRNWMKRLNYIALILGFISGYGLIVTGSFQNRTQLSGVHYFGAIMAFGGGSLYCCVVTVIGRHMALVKGQKMTLTIIRILMCSCLIGGIAILLTAAVVANHQYDDHRTNRTHNKFHWGPSDKGYAAHVINTSAEWLVAGVMFSFFLTYFSDFRSFTLSVLVTLKENHGYHGYHEISNDGRTS